MGFKPKQPCWEATETEEHNNRKHNNEDNLEGFRNSEQD